MIDHYFPIVNSSLSVRNPKGTLFSFAGYNLPLDLCNDLVSAYYLS